MLYKVKKSACRKGKKKDKLIISDESFKLTDFLTAHVNGIMKTLLPDAVFCVQRSRKVYYKCFMTSEASAVDMKYAAKGPVKPHARPSGDDGKCATSRL